MDISVSLDELKLLRKIGKVSDELGLESYVVGGFVRDKIIQKPTKDIDIVCVGDALTFAQKCAESLGLASEVHIFKNYGTAHFKYEQGIDIEFVGARKESYQKESRNPMVEEGNIEDDQNRRDFRINSLAIGLNKNNFGKLNDPFNGYADIESKIIQTPLLPEQTFEDDPLRMLRAIRFAAQLGFEITKDTFDAIKYKKHRIEIISNERIVDELHKMIMSPKPSLGFRLLYDSGLLHIILPELTDLAGVDYIDGKGHKDNFYHSLEVLDNLSEHTTKLWLRWAGLLHDIGKPPTKRFDEKSGWTFHGHDLIGGRMAVKLFKRLKMPLNEHLPYVKKLIELHLRPISLSQENITDSAVRRLLFDAGEDIEDLMLLCESDITSKNELKVKKFKQNFNIVRQRLIEVEEKDHIMNWQPPINGKIIMETFLINQGEMIGKIKNEIRDAILDAVIDNTYEAAFEYMLLSAEKYGLKRR